MVSALKNLIPEMEEFETMEGNVRGIFLGSFMSLDPCGRYHHFLSPNGLTEECEEFWETLHEAANEADGWIGDSDGDACDVFFYMGVEDDEIIYD